MINIEKMKKSVAGLLFFSIASVPAVQACTGSKIQARDGSVVFARTMEFGAEIDSDVVVIPRHYELKATSPYEGKNLVWKSKYAAMGMNAKSLPLIIEGVNEKGLRVGTFYFPGFAGYQQVTPEQAANSVSSVDVGVWLLSNFASIAEAKAGLQSIKVSNAIFKPWGFSLPLHYVISEPDGKSLIVEYMDGKMNLYDDELGVLTNAPEFAWHLTNLRNYVNLKPEDVSENSIPNLPLKDLGLGSGMLGLPGDFTSPSRFVRAALFTATMPPSENGHEAVLELFHLLNNFDVPKGVVVEKMKGETYYDHTQWTSAIDLKKKQLFVHTYEDRNLKMIDLSKFDLNAKTIKVIKLKSATAISDVSSSVVDFTS
ncbi:linear amide C-N hydrolase [Legionella spiritensis]|uniref:Choloylglycine hydrolase n=1 Tax=Legionella spiritensis TaxID=452 RepID=A0A0W0Z3B0_LEGSP|nr:choloylglycine hydrolase family protein [Legionella spiritensis]KTD63343.1 choloylglycine hydrolase [Legionella spiritensis]SNV35486.1 choloylglycine hydrolase [Legionella spiritensis]